MIQSSLEKPIKSNQRKVIIPKDSSEFKVDNAVILAAGPTKDTIYAPPKGLFIIDGVPIIERQICQLREAGIEEIYIVVGYKQEMYFYLEDKYGVKLVSNPETEKNNIYSLYLVRDILKNTYVCACDYYYKVNPFSNYEYYAYHGTTYLNDAKKKFIITKNINQRITGIQAGAESGECMHGLAYFDRQFSETFVRFLEQEIDHYRISSMFWEEFFARHISDLDMFARSLDAEEALEFDDLRALKTLNLLFVDSVSTQIKENICSVLKCKENEINNVDILQSGHSNITFRVDVKGEAYVYRYPGASSKNIVVRKREMFSNQLAKDLGIDNTLVYIDESGHKISKYVFD